MDRIALSFLGPFSARLESGAVVAVPTRKAQALLAYLACSRVESHSRDYLATIFWGDLPECHTRHSLRQTLYVLRLALASHAPSVLCGDSTSVWLDRSQIVVDVLDFERLITTGTQSSLEHASALYKGPFLAGIVGGVLEFEDWLRTERDRLQELAIRACGKLAEMQHDAGMIERAIGSAQRVLGIDPTEESAHRMLMRLHVAEGRPAAARRQYERCARMLHRELGVEPNTETKNLLRAISLCDPRRDLLPADSCAGAVNQLPVPKAGLSTKLRN
jgi:DNA-binding SARP family transcriptional activator